MNDFVGWYLLYCKRGQEQRAQDNLALQNIVTFYPKIEVERNIAGKMVTRTEALFPSYAFVEVSNETNLSSIRSTRGVLDFVRRGKVPIKVPLGLIHYLMEFKATTELREHVTVKNSPKQFVKGENLLIENSTFNHVEAVFHKKNGDERSIVLINILSQQSKLDVCNKELRKINT